MLLIRKDTLLWSLCPPHPALLKCSLFLESTFFQHHLLSPSAPSLSMLPNLSEVPSTARFKPRLVYVRRNAQGSSVERQLSTKPTPFTDYDPLVLQRAICPARSLPWQISLLFLSSLFSLVSFFCTSIALFLKFVNLDVQAHLLNSWLVHVCPKSLQLLFPIIFLIWGCVVKLVECQHCRTN